MPRAKIDDKIAKLKAQKEKLDEQIKKEEEAKEQELCRLVWREMKKYIITMDDYHNFKQAMDRGMSIEFLYAKGMLPEDISQMLEDRLVKKNEESGYMENDKEDELQIVDATATESGVITKNEYAYG